MNTGNLDTFFDFKGLGELKAQSSKADNSEAVDKVAKQFEAYFIREMLKSMRLAGESFKSDLFDSRAMDTFQDMFDQQISVGLGERGSLGLRAVLTESLDRMRPQSISGDLQSKSFPLEMKTIKRPVDIDKPKDSYPLTDRILRFRGAGL